jgi:hypothetical protein
MQAWRFFISFMLSYGILVINCAVATLSSYLLFTSRFRREWERMDREGTLPSGFTRRSFVGIGNFAAAFCLCGSMFIITTALVDSFRR